MRTWPYVSVLVLAACADDIPREDPAPDSTIAAAQPYVCDLPEINRTGDSDLRGQVVLDPRLRLPGPRQPPGGALTPPEPLQPNDPRYDCLKRGACSMRVVSGDQVWTGAIVDGELVVSVNGESTIVDAVGSDAGLKLIPSADGLRIEIVEAATVRAYRVCVDG